MESDVADEQVLLERRRSLEAALEAARIAETEAEDAVRAGVPRLTAAQETWYSLAALRERVATTLSIAGERVRNADDEVGELRHGRDPEELDREAAKTAAEEAELAAEAGRRADALEAASEARERAENDHRAEETRLAGLLRAAADRREGLARLTGQVNSLRSRSEAAEAEIGRLTAASQEAELRAEQASRAFTALETTVAGLEGGESGLDTDHDAALARLENVEAELAELRQEESAAGQERAALAARVEALQVGLVRKDASAALLAATERLDGVLGSMAALIEVDSGYEVAVAAALGAAADAVAVQDVDAAVEAFGHLKAEDLGRANLVVAEDLRSDSDELGLQPVASPRMPAIPSDIDARRMVDVIRCDPRLEPAIRRLLGEVAVVPDLDEARTLVAARSDVTAVTRDGDVLGAYAAAGGSSAQPSLIEVQAAIDDATEKLGAANHACERLRFAQTELASRQEAAAEAVEMTLGRLHESDAAMAAVAEELGQLSASARSAHGEAERLRNAIGAAEDARDRDLAGLADLEYRLERAIDTEDDPEPDPARRDQLAEDARLARAAEMDARLALRTMEERVRALAGRADALRRAAENERQSRAKAIARRERLRREAEVARAVLSAGTLLAQRVDASIALAAAERAEADAARTEAEASLGAARKTVRTYAADFEGLVDTAHRDEMARTEHRMRIESLQEKAMAELGLAPDALSGDYGPELPIPVLTRPDGTALTADDEIPEPRPYVREEQQKRLRAAERNLAVLGRVNPLALEEFDAMEERHRFLSEQLEDLRKTRRDLTDIIADVDARVEQVFADAYADVEKAFERVFARLFPGGEGRLVLTEPGNWLTTGIDVEARPPGKKIKRLSLLSGGERSLVAVAFLVSLFIARPSPFYILDEVEAALDDTNLGRLLEIYEELRESSQLLVITHQKRTMEIADALYGVTMRGDGVSAVISQRLREVEVA